VQKRQQREQTIAKALKGRDALDQAGMTAGSASTHPNKALGANAISGSACGT
jgi:hypothetical protein